MTPGPGLDSLLASLRGAGLTVGVTEAARLARVFELAPELPGGEPVRRLRSLLAAVVVKSAEDRAAFDRVFDAWFQETEQDLAWRAEPPAAGAKAPLPRRPRWRRGWLAAALLGLLALGLAGAGYWFFSRAVQEKILAGKLAKTTPAQPEPAEASSGLSPADVRNRTFRTWVPTLVVTEGRPVWEGWPALGLAVLALATAAWLWHKLRGRRYLPRPAPAPDLKGPPRVLPAPPPASGPLVLEPRQQEALVWGIGRFVAEEQTRRLDLPATVRATARAAGLPQVRFHAARFYREVWLWVDEAADDPALPRLAAEVEAALRAHGLPVERAAFRGVPRRLATANGQVFAPSEVDERRDAALVAILTDGRVLSLQHAADDRRVAIDALLRGLSRWPRLAFVDFSRGENDLRLLLARHGVEAVAPGELAGFLGGSAAAGPASPGRPGEVEAWAAACALSPAPVDESTALELRRRLGLAAPPWALAALRAEAPGPPGRLAWRLPERVRRLGWLSRSEAHAGRVAPGSLLARALDFWEEVYARETRRREAAEPALPWRGTPGEQHLAMERALLALWRKAGEAARQLYALHQGALRETIQQHLGALAPAGWGGGALVELPWRWEERPAAERVMLAEMGLGGTMPAETLRRPGRLWLGLALCLGLAAGALAVAAGSGMRRPGGVPVLVHGEGRPANAVERFKKPPIVGSWDVTFATPEWVETRRVEAGSRIAVSWALDERSCVEDLGGGAEVWRCGTSGQPTASPEVGRHSVAVLAGPHPDAERLAMDLLESGSAHLVYLIPGFSPTRESAASSLRYGPVDQMLFITPAAQPRAVATYLPFLESALASRAGFSWVQASRWSELAQALRFLGIRPLREVWPNAGEIRRGKSRPLFLRGLLGSRCRPAEETGPNGMVFVRLCPGTFWMGSEGEDPRGSDERPAHPVTLSAFAIGKFEVTNRQYRTVRPEHRSTENADDLPVTDVSWHDAQAFCESVGGRLPTEAEWEYAARAGTVTDWAFGDDAERLGDHTWFGFNSGGQPHPAGTREPNPWGLHDMHGNVWEWVADWYGPYEPAPQTNPPGPKTGELRGLRGGSFAFSPRFLRSALRFRFRPGDRYWGVGFRCVQSPDRQP